MIRLRKTRGDAAFDLALNAGLVLVLLITVVPLWYVVSTSLTPLRLWGNGGARLLLAPQDWSFAAYAQLLGQDTFVRAALNSVIITSNGTLLNIVLTVLMAYPLSRRSLPGRKLLTGFILFTFLFNAGLIPTYLLVQKLGLVNSFAAVILPGAISVYNVLVMKSFFEGLPEALEDAARIDGANDFQVLWHIILPLSQPILLTIGLFYAVAHWNEFFLPILYLNDSRLMPLPVLLHNILISSGIAELVESDVVSATSQESLKTAAVVLTTLPMLLIYPWIQRHFTRGVLLGGVKD